MSSKRFIKISFPILLLAGVYFLGLAPDKPEYNDVMPVVPQAGEALEAFIAANEANHAIKPDNQARIIWNDSSKQKTPYAIVYLHGFSASQEEGDPVHRRVAETFGCNLYLPRL